MEGPVSQHKRQLFYYYFSQITQNSLRTTEATSLDTMAEFKV
jgi:hypothetical protein